MFTSNSKRNVSAPLRPVLTESLGREGRMEAASVLAGCLTLDPTPLYRLSARAKALGIGDLHVKDEGQRLEMNSFKALGGAYAVIRLALLRAATRLGRPVTPQELTSAAVQAETRDMVVVCATDGNHGKSVALGARLAGCRALVLVHQGVSDTRAAAIAALGAEVFRFAGTYDASVEEAARLAQVNGWTVVSDTSWEGYEHIPLMVMQGYTIMAGEAFDALPAPPTHIFVQAGVGGLAASVAAHALAVYGPAMPKVVVVEPQRAACIFASALAGFHTSVPPGAPTIMGMLDCYEPSRVAWEILDRLAVGFVTLPEEAAIEAMALLAYPQGGDPAIVSGESGCTGLAGLLACLRDPEARSTLDVGPDARVLVFNSEGATDPALYRRYVGLAPEEVRA